MAEPFLGQLKLIAFTYAPRGYAECDGQILPINQYQSLYSLLGTTYGGDGRTTFGLPELRGRTPVGPGSGTSGWTATYGQKAGQADVVLTTAQLPTHTHNVVASTSPATGTDATNSVLAKGTSNVYAPTGTKKSLSTNATLPAGGNQQHNNMQPYLAIKFVIALQGTFPSRN